MKKNLWAAVCLALLVSCLLAGCGGNPEAVPESRILKALEAAGSYRGSLELTSELGIRLDTEDLPEDYAGLTEGGEIPKIRRKMLLEVAEDLASGRSTMTGSISFSDPLGEQTADAAFAGENEKMFLYENKIWGRENLAAGKAVLAFFRDVFPALEAGGTASEENDAGSGRSFLVYEGRVEKGGELFKTLACMDGDVPAEAALPVKLWADKESNLPERLELTVTDLGDRLLQTAFAESWVDSAWFSLESCTLTFRWTAFGEAGGLGLPEGTAKASLDVTIPDSMLPALLYAGSVGLLERRNANLAMLDQLLEDLMLGEPVPADDSGFLPEDDVEEFSEPDESFWMRQGENPGWLTLTFSNVGTVGLSVPEGYQLSGYDGSFAEVTSTDADGRERVADYFLEYAFSPQQVEEDVCSPQGFSAELGYRDVEIGSAQAITINGINARWRGAVYVQDRGDGTQTCFRDVHVWTGLGGGVFRLQISVPCASIEEARSLNPENLVWEFFSLVSPVS